MFIVFIFFFFKRKKKLFLVNIYRKCEIETKCLFLKFTTKKSCIIFESRLYDIRLKFHRHVGRHRCVGHSLIYWIKDFQTDDRNVSFAPFIKNFAAHNLIFFSLSYFFYLSFSFVAFVDFNFSKKSAKIDADRTKKQTTRIRNGIDHLYRWYLSLDLKANNKTIIIHYFGKHANHLRCGKWHCLIGMPPVA